MSSICLLSVENLSTSRLLWVPNSAFNQRSENMKKEKKTVKEEKTVT